MNIASDNNEIRRSLSAAERCYWICDQLSPLNVVAQVRIHGKITDGALRFAADALQSSHPLLRVAVDMDSAGSNPVFIAPRDLSIPIFSGPGEGDVPSNGSGSFVCELNRSFEIRNSPLARISDIVSSSGGSDEKHDLALVLSHVIADGRTAILLLRELVEYAYSFEKESGGRNRRRSTREAPDKLLPPSHRGMRGILRMGGLMISQMTGVIRKPQRITPEVPVPADQRTTAVARRHISAATFREIQLHCTAQSIELSSLLAAVLAEAVASKAMVGRCESLRVGDSIDFRDVLCPPAKLSDAGAYMAMVGIDVPVSKSVRSNIWDVARQVQQKRARLVRGGAHLTALMGMRMMAPESAARSDRMVSLSDSYGPGNVCIVNAGDVGLPEYIGEWRLSDSQFLASLSVNGYLAACTVISNDQLFLNLCYVDGIISQQRGNRIADAMVQILVSLVDENAGARRSREWQ